jgi:hypothetical protein
VISPILVDRVFIDPDRFELGFVFIGPQTEVMEELAKDAICFGHTDELEELLDKGVDPNSKDESGPLGSCSCESFSFLCGACWTGRAGHLLTLFFRYNFIKY